MELSKADHLNFDPRLQMGDIFAEGFYEHLKYFSKDKSKLAKAFAPAFNLSKFYVAFQGGQVMAVTGCSDKKAPVLLLEKKILRKHLGLIRGTLAYTFLNKMMVNKPYPFNIENGMGIIDFVATASKFRRKGITYQLMEYVMEKESYKRYILEVVDNNTNALRLYTKLGFKQFMRVAEKHPKQAGFDYYLYMEKER